MRLRDGGRIAVIGAGPSGLTVAKHALQGGFDVTVFEASDRLGGQWYTTAPHSGVWPGMRTNTSRAMTAFSDHPAPLDHPLHPAAEQIHAYLEDYATTFALRDRIRLNTRVQRVEPEWTVDGEPFDAVVIASGRFHTPRLPDVVAGFAGELLHAFDYPGAEAFRGRSVLVYGNGVSGVEIASDLAPRARVISSFRKSRYVLQKVVDGVSSDWQWYTTFGALERRALSPEQWSRRQRERILRVAGDPADFGAPAPDGDVRVAGVSLCQGYLSQIRAGEIECRPGIAAVAGRTVTFTDGSSAEVDAIVCATGYAPDLPYLSAAGASPLELDLDASLYLRTFHPDRPGLAVIGQFLAQGPYFPLLELQARWIVDVWSGVSELPDRAAMRGAVATPRPPLESHNVLALDLAEAMGVAPDVGAWPDLAEPLLFGPMLPPRYRLSGAGARPDAAAEFARQLGASRSAPVDPADRRTLSAWDAGLARGRVSD